MKTHRIHHNIAISIPHTSVDTEFVKSLLILSLITLISPVFQGCSGHPEDSDFTEAGIKHSVKLAVQKTSDAGINTMNILVFNDDQLQRIDCIQREVHDLICPISVGSCNGKKIILLCANMDLNRHQWSDYDSFQEACSMKAELEDEDRSDPIMATYAHIVTGNDYAADLERLTSEVELRTIRSEFSGKPYSGETVEEAKAYLINVNATCSIVPQENEPIERLVNHGGLIEQDISLFKDRTLIYKEIEDIGAKATSPSCKFLCYPNTSLEESFGTPFTRLVIEGKIQGETWYWPIDINREAAGTGIERNCRYVFDITLRGKGTKDPNTPVTAEMTEIQFETKKWNEKEAYYVEF